MVPWIQTPISWASQAAEAIPKTSNARPLTRIARRTAIREIPWNRHAASNKLVSTMRKKLLVIAQVLVLATASFGVFRCLHRTQPAYMVAPPKPQPIPERDTHSSRTLPADFQVRNPAEGRTGIAALVLTQASNDPVPNAQLSLHEWKATPLSFVERNDGASEPPRIAAGTLPTTTDEDGEAFLPVEPQRRYRLLVRAPSGIAYATVDIAPLAPTEYRAITIELDLATHMVFIGQVVSEEDGTPLANAVARAGLSPVVSGDTAPLDVSDCFEEALTDSTGLFRINYPLHPQCYAVVRAEGFSPQLAIIDDHHGSPADALVIRMSPTASLTIKVTYADESAAGNIAVRVRSDTYGFVTPEVQTIYEGHTFVAWSSATSSSGVASFMALPSSLPLYIDIYPSSNRVYHLPEPVLLTEAENRSLTVRLPAAKTIHGILLDDSGGPVIAAQVLLKLADEDKPTVFSRSEDDVSRTMTDGFGRFDYDSVTTGYWWVGASPFPTADGRHIAPIAQVVVVSEELDSVDIVLRPGAAMFVRGIVCDEDGQVISGAYIHASSGDCVSVPGAISGTDGTFSLGPLPNLRLALTAYPGSDSLLSPSEEIAITAGQENVRLVLPPGGAVSGRMVHAASGKMVPGELFISSANRNAARESVRRVGRFAGEFSAGGLHPGDYYLFASAPPDLFGGPYPATVSTDGTTENLVLQTSKGSCLRLRYECGPYASVSYNLSVGGITFARGRIPLGGSSGVRVPRQQVDVEYGAMGRVVAQRTLSIDYRDLTYDNLCLRD